MTNRVAPNSTDAGFTIVELLIVIVVIAILAAITIVSYNGITNRAKASSAQMTVKQIDNKIRQYSIEHADSFPATLAAINVTNNNNTTYQYYVNNAASPRKFCIAASEGTTSYYISNTQSSPQEGDCYSQNIINSSFDAWESGQYSQTTGEPTTDTTRVRHIDLVAVEPGASYVFNTNASAYQFAVRTYDTNRSFINSIGSVATGSTYTIPAGVSYISLTIYGPGALSYSTYTTNFGNGKIIPTVVRAS